MSKSQQAGMVTVLLVEDDEVDVKAVERAIAKKGIHNPVKRAQDGAEALEMLRLGAVPKPYIIVLDLNLPGMNGLEMLRQLRADNALQDAVVFVLTTSQARGDKLAAYSENVAGYIVKRDCIDYERFVTLLDQYWSLVDLPA